MGRNSLTGNLGRLAVLNKIAVAIFAAASAFPSKQLSSIRLTKEKLGFEIEA
jgi:hypothetical protein